MHSRFLIPHLSCLPVSLYDDFKTGRLNVNEWASEAQKLELDAMDLNVFMLRMLKEKPLFPVDTVAAYTDFTHPDSSVREKEFEMFKKDVVKCEEIGAEYFRITAGQAHPGTPVEKGLEWADKYLNLSAEFAGKHDIKLLFENHSKPGAWRHCDFAAGSKVYDEIVRRLRKTPIKLLFDTANAVFYGRDPVCMLDEIFDDVKRIHIADIMSPETFKPVLIGSGCVPLGAVFGFLKKKDYSGGLSIEEASFGGMAGLKKAVDITTELWGNS